MSLKNDKFLKLSDFIINPYVEEWKKNNKKVIGYYCTYIPEELLHAAGLLPYRIRATGNEDTDLGDVYMVRFTCSFVRMTLDLALKGGYDFLDGLFILSRFYQCILDQFIHAFRNGIDHFPGYGIDDCTGLLEAFPCKTVVIVQGNQLGIGSCRVGNLSDVLAREFLPVTRVLLF